MGNLFGRPKPPSRITEQDKAVLQLKQQRDKLKQYAKRIELSLEKEKQIARQLLRDGKREKAKSLLRKKRFQEQMIEKTLGQLDNIERLIADIEFAQIETKVIAGLKVGNDCLKKMHELLSLEDVEKIMEDTRESVEYQHEIDSIISGALTPADEQDVLDELDELLQAEKGQEEAAEGEIVGEINLPDVPTDEVVPRNIAEAAKAKRARQQAASQRQAALAQ